MIVLILSKVWSWG